MPQVINPNNIRSENIQLQPINPTIPVGSKQMSALQRQLYASAQRPESALSSLNNARNKKPPSYSALDYLEQSDSLRRQQSRQTSKQILPISGLASDVSGGAYRYGLRNMQKKVLLGNTIIDSERTPKLIPSDYYSLIKRRY